MSSKNDAELSAMANIVFTNIFLHMRTQYSWQHQKINDWWLLPLFVHISDDRMMNEELLQKEEGTAAEYEI